MYNKATLVNVVFEPSADALKSEDAHIAYQSLLKSEQKDFKIFELIMRKSGIYDVFQKDCGFEFCIKYMSVAEFMNLYHMIPQKKEYLRRYTLDGKESIETCIRQTKDWGKGYEINSHLLSLFFTFPH